MNLQTKTAHELLGLLKAGQTTPQAIHQDVLAQIAAHDGKIKAYLRYTKAPTQQTYTEGAFPIPLAVKDNMCQKGVETTCSAHILEGFHAPYDATVIEKLKQKSAVFIGNCNMDEFAFGSSTENAYFGPTCNPWNTACVPGGSSGGSAAAVAADEAIWALGSDTGGSIRQPAAFCGIVGLKPTYGLVSRYGLIAFASSLDQIGPLTKDVRDAALLLNLIAGHDPRDSTSAKVSVPDYTQALEKDIRGLKIGIPKEYFIDGMQPCVEKAVKDAIEVLRKQGAEFKEISLPHTQYAVATYYIVATAEASSNLARFDGVQYGHRAIPADPRKNSIVDMYEESRDQGFGPETKRRIMLGTYALSSGYYDAYYLKGLKVRTLIKQDFETAFKEVDAIISPTSPTTAFKIGERTDDPLAMYLSDIFTISSNLSGIPALSMPCGFDKEGLPIGLQLMTKAFDEETLFRLAYSYEQNTEWHKKRALQS